jgi:hypothetical protein
MLYIRTRTRISYHTNEWKLLSTLKTNRVQGQVSNGEKSIRQVRLFQSAKSRAWSNQGGTYAQWAVTGGRAGHRARIKAWREGATSPPEFKSASYAWWGLVAAGRGVTEAKSLPIAQGLLIACVRNTTCPTAVTDLRRRWPRSTGDEAEVVLAVARGGWSAAATRGSCLL